MVPPSATRSHHGDTGARPSVTGQAQNSLASGLKIGDRKSFFPNRVLMRLINEPAGARLPGMITVSSRPLNWQPMSFAAEPAGQRGHTAAGRRGRERILRTSMELITEV